MLLVDFHRTIAVLFLDRHKRTLHTGRRAASLELPGFPSGIISNGSGLLDRLALVLGLAGANGPRLFVLLDHLADIARDDLLGFALFKRHRDFSVG